jgi:hypothetical protein
MVPRNTRVTTVAGLESSREDSADCIVFLGSRGFGERGSETIISRHFGLGGLSVLGLNREQNTLR